MGHNKEVSALYRKNNKEKIKEKYREFYKNNKEKIKEKSREFYKNNKEKRKNTDKKNWYIRVLTWIKTRKKKC